MLGDRGQTRDGRVGRGGREVEQRLGAALELLAVGLVACAAGRFAVRERPREPQRRSGDLGETRGELERVLRAGRLVDADDDLGHDSSFPGWCGNQMVSRLGYRSNRARPHRCCGNLRTAATVHLVVNDPFKALSHPIRRGIVERLAVGPATVGDATAGFGVSKPAITKHLKVLEETGVVTRVIEGRTHRLSLAPDVLTEAADWMDRQRAVWGRLFDVVDDYLKESR